MQISQAVTAIEAAWKDGIKRQRLELLLPLIGATDLDDWPGGIRQQFKAAAPLVEGECADAVRRLVLCSCSPKHCPRSAVEQGPTDSTAPGQRGGKGLHVRRFEIQGSWRSFLEANRCQQGL